MNVNCFDEVLQHFLHAGASLQSIAKRTLHREGKTPKPSLKSAWLQHFPPPTPHFPSHASDFLTSRLPPASIRAQLPNPFSHLLSTFPLALPTSHALYQTRIHRRMCYRAAIRTATAAKRLSCVPHAAVSASASHRDMPGTERCLISHGRTYCRTVLSCRKNSSRCLFMHVNGKHT